MSARQPIRHFLLVFDHDLGRLVEQIDFGRDIDRALKVYGEREEAIYRLPRGQRPHLEIVLIGSDSIETVRRTHANYFEGSPGESKYFEAAGLR